MSQQNPLPRYSRFNSFKSKPIFGFRVFLENPKFPFPFHTNCNFKTHVFWPWLHTIDHDQNNNFRKRSRQRGNFGKILWVCRFSVLRKERKLYWNAVVIVTRVWRVWALARGKSIVHSSGNSLGTEIYHQIFVFINGRNQCEDFCRYGGEAMDFQWHKTEIFDNASVWTGPEPGEIKISHQNFSFSGFGFLNFINYAVFLFL